MRVIHIGETYYHRDTDDRSYCVGCAERHSSAWFEHHRTHEESLVELDQMLTERARTGKELETRFGSRALAMVRKLNRTSLMTGGGGIWIDKKGSGAIYSLSPPTRDQRCLICHSPLDLSLSVEERRLNPRCSHCIRKHAGLAS
jgi:hypothetical protein